MKKIGIVATILALMLFLVSTVSADTIFTDDFESGLGEWTLVIPEGDTEEDGVIFNEETTAHKAHSPTKAAFMYGAKDKFGTVAIERYIDLTDFEDAKITFWWAEESLDADEKAEFRISLDDGETWDLTILLAEGATGTDSTTTPEEYTEVEDLDLSDYDGQTILIRFSADLETGNHDIPGDLFIIDDVTVTGDLVSSGNNPPSITSTAITSAVEDQTYTYDVEATDPDTGDTLTYSLTTKPDGMSIDSSTGIITWTPNEDQIGNNDVVVVVVDDGTPPEPKAQSFTVLVRPDDVCGDYISGSYIEITDWDITDDDEDFYPGDKIEIEVDIENDGDEEIEDIVVEAILYDVTDGKRIDVIKSEEFDLDEDEDETIELILEIPEDLDTDNDLVVFISAYEDGNDAENCDWESNDDLDFKRRKHDIAIEKVLVTPSTAKAGSTVEVKVDVENVGDRDEDDSYVRVKNGELGIDKKSELFEVEAYEKGDDDEYSVTISFTVPTNAEEGNYDLEVYVYNDDDEIYESGHEFVTLFIQGIATQTTTETETGTVTITTEGTPEGVEQGTAFTIPVKLTNTADETKEYKITVTNIGDWAKSTSEFDAYLTAGQSSTYYVTITPNEDAAEGKHSATINVKEGTTTIATKTLSFTIPGTTSGITGGTVLDMETEDEGFKMLSGTTLWVIADIILVLIAIFFIKMLFSKRS